MAAYCVKCSTEVPSEVELSEVVTLVKNCPVCGQTRHIIASDTDFYLMSKCHDDRPGYYEAWLEQIRTTGIDVTRRCNVACPHCYVEPENRTKDISIDEVVITAKKIEKSESIILMGAEPTVRDDLPELIHRLKEETGKSVGIYTNAVRFSESGYVKTLIDAGLNYCSISLHTKDYLGFKLFKKKVGGIINAVESGLPIHHVSFTLQNMSDIPEVLNTIKSLNCAQSYRIRSPQRVGICEDSPIELSDLFKQVSSLIDCEIIPSDNNPYHIHVKTPIGLIRLINWPSLDIADLDQLRGPPYALFDPEHGEVNLVYSFLLQEANRRRKS